MKMANQSIGGEKRHINAIIISEMASQRGVAKSGAGENSRKSAKWLKMAKMAWQANGNGGNMLKSENSIMAMRASGVISGASMSMKISKREIMAKKESVKK
jgi:hypothetical protein